MSGFRAAVVARKQRKPKQQEKLKKPTAYLMTRGIGAGIILYDIDIHDEKTNPRLLTYDWIRTLSQTSLQIKVKGLPTTQACRIQSMLNYYRQMEKDKT